MISLLDAARAAIDELMKSTPPLGREDTWRARYVVISNLQTALFDAQIIPADRRWEMLVQDLAEHVKPGDIIGSQFRNLVIGIAAHKKFEKPNF